MNDGEHPTITEIEMVNALLGHAKAITAYHRALLDEGWPEAKAFQLTMGYQHALCGGKAAS